MVPAFGMSTATTTDADGVEAVEVRGLNGVVAGIGDELRFGGRGLIATSLPIWKISHLSRYSAVNEYILPRCCRQTWSRGGAFDTRTGRRR